MSTLRRLIGLITTLHMLQSTVVHAWSDHASLAWPLLRVMPEVQNAEPLRVETLNEFVVAERTAIAELLAQHEDWALQNLEHYAALKSPLHRVLPERPRVCVCPASIVYWWLRQLPIECNKISLSICVPCHYRPYSRTWQVCIRPGCERAPWCCCLWLSWVSMAVV